MEKIFASFKGKRFWIVTEIKFIMHIIIVINNRSDFKPGHINCIYGMGVVVVKEKNINNTSTAPLIMAMEEKIDRIFMILQLFFIYQDLSLQPTEIVCVS